MQNQLRLVLFCLSFHCTTSLFLNFIPPAQASKSKASPSQKTSIVQYRPPTPPNLGIPQGRQRGGASRGICQSSEALQALMPHGGDTTAWGLTTSERPTFWFYVPRRSSVDVPIEFVLQDPSDEYVYKTVLIPQDTSSGILGIELPENSPALIPGVLYSWTMSIGCNPNQDSEVMFVRGYIQRQVLTGSVAHPVFRPRSPFAQAAFYAEQGFWYDAVTAMAQARRTQPANHQILQGWQTLLYQGGLSDLETAMLLPCCDRDSSGLIGFKGFNAKD